MSRALAIVAAGMVSADGNNAAATCAALRAGVRGVSDSKLWDYHAGDYLRVGRPLLHQWWEGRDLLAELAAPAVEECLVRAEQLLGLRPDDIPILLIVAARDRPLRWTDLDREALADLSHKLGRALPRGSALLPLGRSGFVHGLLLAQHLLAAKHSEACVVVGVESFLKQSLVEHYMLHENRILTIANSNGFTLGEAAGAVLVTSARRARTPHLLIAGMGEAKDASGAGGNAQHAAKGDGLTQAIRMALRAAALEHSAVDLRMSDANGEHWKFKEAVIANARLDRLRPASAAPRRFGYLDHWHPCELIGDVGAAVGPLMLGWTLHAGIKRYLPGPCVLVHAAEDNGERAALIAEFTAAGTGRSAP